MLKHGKRRYLALEIDSVEAFDSQDVMDAVWRSILGLYGAYGASQANLSLIDYDSEERLAVVRVSHLALEKVRASIALVTRIRERPAAIHVVRVSGTIRTLRKKTRQ